MVDLILLGLGLTSTLALGYLYFEAEKRVDRLKLVIRCLNEELDYTTHEKAHIDFNKLTIKGLKRSDATD